MYENRISELQNLLCGGKLYFPQLSWSVSNLTEHVSIIPNSPHMFHAAITKVFPAKIGNWSWCHRFSFDKAHTEYWNTETWKGSISSWKLIYLAKKMLPVVLYFYDKIKIHYKWIFENAEIFYRYIEPKFWIPGDLYWWSWTALGTPTLEFKMSMGSWLRQV